MNKKTMKLDSSGLRFERVVDKKLFGNTKIIEDSHVTWDVSGSKQNKGEDR
tara:strand:+ start:555 stop:707 length:153 start_codon:yes stop_codon:yes gene_type:complete